MPEGEVSCYLCGEGVVKGVDYKIHVAIAHGAEYDVERSLDGDDSENVTLAKHSEIPNVKADNYIGQLETIHLGVGDEVKEAGENNDIKSYFDKLNEKLKQIKDVAEGKIEPFSYTDADKIELVDDNQIWQMFENIKSKVMNIEVQETPITTNNSFQKLQVQGSDSMNNCAQRKWYHGTFYNCKDCHKTFYGQEYFRKHLSNKHKSYPMSIQEMRVLSSQYEETLYTCKVCEKKVKHEFKNIYVHLKKHSLTINEYETTFVSIKEEVGTLPSVRNVDENIPSKQKLEVLTSLSETHLTQKVMVNVKKLHPSKTQMDNAILSRSPYLHIRRIKSEVEIIPHDPENLLLKQPPSTTMLFNLNAGNHKSNKPQSLYYCPVPECSFYTTKKGMKSSQAALHLKNDHKIKAKDMKPGMYKFKKVNV